MKKITEYSLLIVLLIPILFINNKVSHDWGDDFAQYLHQAKNIVEGVSQNETGYIFNEAAFIGPKAYPTGFPLILSAIVAFEGVDAIYSFNILMSLFLVLSCFVGYLILRWHVSHLTALFTTLIIAYNPGMLMFKNEILSDLPYTFFSLLCIYLFYKKETPLLSIFLGLLIGFSIHIRSVGFVLLAAYVLFRIFSNGLKVKNNKNLIFTIASTMIVFLALRFAFPCDTNYPISFTPEDLWFNGNNQISYNFEKLTLFFRNFENENFYYVGVIASSCLIGFALLGFLLFIKQKLKAPITIYFILYVVTIILFQFGNAGIRFLFPVLVFIFLFAIEGMKVGVKALITNTKWLPVILGVFVLFSYTSEIQRIISQTDIVLDGPQTAGSKELFNYINSIEDENAVVAFNKPRALALYTNKKSVKFGTLDSYTASKNELDTFDIKYILIGTNPDLVNNTLLAIKDTAFCKPVFTNSEFSLYKLVGK